MTTLWDSIKKSFKDGAKIAKDGATIAAEKAEELGKRSKLMLDISNIKRRIEKHFTELGGKVYHGMQEENITDFAGREDVAGLVQAIKELDDELNQKQQELDAVGRQEEEPAAGPAPETGVETESETGPAQDIPDESDEEGK